MDCPKCKRFGTFNGKWCSSCGYDIYKCPKCNGTRMGAESGGELGHCPICGYDGPPGP